LFRQVRIFSYTIISLKIKCFKVALPSREPCRALFHRFMFP
jgi:hypothetical protein